VVYYCCVIIFGWLNIEFTRSYQLDYFCQERFKLSILWKKQLYLVGRLQINNKLNLNGSVC